MSDLLKAKYRKHHVVCRECAMVVSFHSPTIAEIGVWLHDYKDGHQAKRHPVL